MNQESSSSQSAAPAPEAPTPAAAVPAAGAAGSDSAAPNDTKASATQDDEQGGEPIEVQAVVSKPQKRWLRFTIIMLNVVLVLFLLKWAEVFFIPFVAGIFLSYTLGPLVDKLEKWKVPRAVGSAIAVLAFIGLMAGTGYAVWYQAVDLAGSIPATMTRINKSLKEMRSSEDSSIGKITEAAQAVDGAIQQPGGAQQGKRNAAAPPVPAAAPPTASSVLLEKSIAVFGGLGTLGSVLLLAYFLLAAGSQFRRKTIKLMGEKLSEKRNLVELLNEVHAALQSYLGWLFLINAMLGAVTFAVLRVQGFENAGVWGVLAGVLHVIPYLGPLITAIGVLVTGLQQWTALTPALIAAGSTIVVASLIGTLAQTWILGRIANINHTAQFVAILFFAWLWGSLGMLIAIPMLVVAKVVSSRVEEFDAVAEFLRDS